MDTLKSQVSQLVDLRLYRPKPRYICGLLDIGDTVAVARYAGAPEWMLGWVTRVGTDSIDALVALPGPRLAEMHGLWHEDDPRIKEHQRLLRRRDMQERGVFRLTRSWERGYFQRRIYVMLLRYLAANDDRVGVLLDTVFRLCVELGKDTLADVLRERSGLPQEGLVPATEGANDAVVQSDSEEVAGEN